MEQNEDLKLAWKKLNEKINANTSVNKKTIEHILDSQRKTAYQKLLSADRSASLFLFLTTIIISYILLSNNRGFLFIKIQVITLCAVATLFNVISYLKLVKIDFNESVLLLYKQVTSYKRLTVWGYIIPYILTITLTCSLLFGYPLPYGVKVFLILMLPICVAIDCFIYHWSANQIRTLVDTTKELDQSESLFKDIVI